MAKAPGREIRIPLSPIILIAVAVALISLIGIAALTVFAIQGTPAETGASSTAELYYKAVTTLSIAIAFGLAALAAGMGISAAGSAALSASAERPELTIWGVIITALAEAIAIYGLLVVIFLLGKI